jgi:hypothetical protein
MRQTAKYRVLCVKTCFALVLVVVFFCGGNTRTLSLRDVALVAPSISIRPEKISRNIGESLGKSFDFMKTSLIKL